jgi:hypothetical protein
MIAKSLLIFITSLFATYVFAQIPTNGLDLKHYDFSITLNDSNNIIKGNAQITTAFIKDENQIVFDLVNRNKDGKGMTVTSVTKNGIALNFSQDSQHLFIQD